VQTHHIPHTHIRARAYESGRQAERRIKGMGKEDIGEGFITRDLLLLPGGGGPLQHRCICGVCLSDTCSSRARVYVCVCNIDIHTDVLHESRCAYRFLATAVCPLVVARPRMHNVARN